MDIPSYDDNGNRLYDTTVRPSVNKTANIFDARAIDNNYAGTYFPDVSIDDTVNKRRVRVPASVAAISAIGFNDRVAYPWFAPAGFNRAALDNVKSVAVRLNTADRDRLSNSRINPIATFPRAGFVIYGQKTLQVAKTSLNRVNVRRLLLEVKRLIIAIANSITFEQNTQATRNLFVKSAREQLGLITAQAGLDDFNVIMDSTNNSAEDEAANKLNGRIVIVPTKSVEMIGIDFIITRSGVEFR
jgi:phage tail sheath protein FI